MVASRLIVVVAVAILAMGGVGAVQTSYQDSVTGANTATQVDNESVTIQHGQTLQLAESNRDVVYGEQSTVTVEQNGTIYTAEGNWAWLRGNGTLSIPSNSGLVDNESATVDYEYTEASNSQKLARDVTMIPLNLGDAIILIVMVSVLLAAVAMFSRGGR